jgi:hypothetical protein
LSQADDSAVRLNTKLNSNFGDFEKTQRRTIGDMHISKAGIEKKQGKTV